MNRTSVLQFTAAMFIILIGATGSLVFGGSWETALIAIVAGVFALSIMIDRHPETAANVVRDPEPSLDLLDNPDFDGMMEGIIEPLLIVANERVVRANRTALRLLGSHIVGEDVRIALRHPAAAERLTHPGASTPGGSINLVGLGQREQRWEMRTASMSKGRIMVHLIDRTGSYAAERMRVDFVANASHELRTPLAAILGFIETLGDPKAGGDRETRDRFLKIMFDEARRMQRLVDDLMSLSRIEAEKYQLPDTPVDLAELIGEVEKIFHERHGKRGMDVVCEIESGLPPVNGDQAQLSQLLHNLVSNSVKYGRPDTPIVVRLTHGSGAMVKLTVTDESEGIDPDHLPRLTERFYRVDSGRSRAMGGTGLGLAIVKHIVERHRGRMDISSIVGKGTNITIHLPPADSANHPAALSSN
ncbi:sensor histidine kinase [Rhizorhapis sp. SPR117]|uniref:sensor histidine kinase n=1 Tax=Rhizorhapis sp. SPR117 TaxID=2912611 RepID=UPI001F35ED3F|nr:ATP-binding protein [Rhizorhapis sp. SPR117]